MTDHSGKDAGYRLRVTLSPGLIPWGRVLRILITNDEKHGLSERSFVLFIHYPPDKWLFAKSQSSLARKLRDLHNAARFGYMYPCRVKFSWDLISRKFNTAKIYYFYSLYWISVKLVADRVTKTTNRIFFAVSQCCLTNKTRCTNGNCSVYKNGSSTVPYKNAQIIIPMSRVWNPISQKFVLTKLEKSKFCENFKPYGTLKVIKSTCGKSTVKLWTAALVELVPNLARNFKIEPFAN